MPPVTGDGRLVDAFLVFPGRPHPRVWVTCVCFTELHLHAVSGLFSTCEHFLLTSKVSVYLVRNAEVPYRWDPRARRDSPKHAVGSLVRFPL